MFQRVIFDEKESLKVSFSCLAIDSTAIQHALKES
jgi:hypothetical protein